MIGRELLGRPATGDETGFGQKPNLFHRDRKLVGDHRAEAVSEERKRAIKVRSELVPQSVDWSSPRSVDGLRLGIQAVHCGGCGFSVGHILLS